MSNLTKRIELAANVAIICVAAMIGVVLIKPYLSGNKGGGSRQREVRVPVGTKLTLPMINWAQNGQTLLLVLQKGCRFCTDSGPFYRRLVQEISTRSDIHLVAVLPQEPSDGKNYLNELGVPINDVRQAELSSVGVVGTPTLILVDEAGAVKDSWVGKLAPEKEAELLARLQSERAGN